MSVAERYVELALKLGRHVDGLVDAYYGEPAVKERIARLRGVHVRRRGRAVLRRPASPHSGGRGRRRARRPGRALMSDRRASQAMKFIADPMWRSYVTTYEDGYELCGAWVDGDAARFRRLLTERLTPADLRKPEA